MTSVAAESTLAVAEHIRDAAARGTALRVVGRGTWLDGGRPVAARETLSTRELSGLVAYVPDDLTLTARAGTTLAEIRDATDPHNQWLALDPFGSADGTLGATVATASCGPASLAFGAPRDLVLGVEFVTGSGTVARGGGRVVKNVAGFDLTRLMTGAWGTLGVLTEITVRLHAKPEADVTLAVDLAGDGESVARVRTLLRRLPFTPYACEIVDASLARALGLGVSAAALVRLGGNAEAVAAQRAALAELGTAREVGAETWAAFRGIEPEGALVCRLSTRPSLVGETWSNVTMVARGVPGALVHANVGRGIVRVVMPPSPQSISAMSGILAKPSRTTCIAERLPAEVWRSVAQAPGNIPLAQRIKQTFDPFNVLNPGILGGAP